MNHSSAGVDFNENLGTGRSLGAEEFPMAPPLQVVQWFNTPEPIELDALRGRVAVIEAFQMLCPGCVHHGVPQAQRLERSFDPAELTVLGLHTVFEHHAVMGPEALAVFISENKIAFPVGVDAPGGEGDPIPRTMRAYRMQGTPTLILIDRAGRLRLRFFGQASDLEVGAAIGRLLGEPADELSR